MPQFGSIHDDGVYFTCAKAWATGQGHRIISLPGEPWQTKYPPLYPLILSIVWRVAPGFPENLTVAAFMSWSFLPPTLLLIYFLYRRYGFPKYQIWLMLAWIAVNPYVHVFSISLLSELPFTLFLLTVFLLVPSWPITAGVVAGLAYLTRTAGLPLLVAVPIVFVLRRQWRWALRFAMAMFPFVLGWTWWSKAHTIRSADPYLMYYLDYAWYERYVVHPSNLHLIVWKNVDALLTGMGSFILPAGANAFEQRLAQTLAVGMIVGIYKMTRDRRDSSIYAVFALLFCALLVVWHYPPNPRFLFPVFPLLLAGFAHQLTLTFRVISHAYSAGRQRAPAVVVSMLLAAMATVILAVNQRFGSATVLNYYRDHRERRNETFECAQRISGLLPANATLMTNHDPAVYLLSGRKAMRMTVPPLYWYEDRVHEIESEWRRLPEVALEHSMTHLFYTRKIQGDLSEEQQHRFMDFLDSAPHVEPVFQCGEAQVYRLR